MFKRPILTALLASVTFVMTLGLGLMVDGSELNASLLDGILEAFEDKAEPLQGSILAPLLRLDPDAVDAEDAYVLDENVNMGKYGEWSYCQYTFPEDAEYGVDVLGVTVDEDIEPGDIFLASVELQNTGNVRLFSADSECVEMEFIPVVNLGTQYEQDRASQFGGNFSGISGWAANNRVKMVESYVDPGEIFHVNFQSIAPGDVDVSDEVVEGNIYREFFQPVVEWVGWMDEPFYVEIEVGEPTEQMRDDMYFVDSLSIDAASLTGLTRHLEVDLSDQMMFAKMGDYDVWAFQVSTGASATPTPRGYYDVLNKQELRIGGAWPHYRMPYWQGWRSDGYGLHALPYLETDGGAFWSEALDHIGIPVSHGCVRQLPDEAEKLYQFTDIGTELYIHD
jgi:hypothetical protein